MHQRSASHSHPLLFQQRTFIISNMQQPTQTKKPRKHLSADKKIYLYCLIPFILQPHFPWTTCQSCWCFFFFIIFNTKIFSSVLFHNTLEILHVFALTAALSFQNSIEYTRTKPPKTLSFPSQKCTSAPLKPSCIYSLIRTTAIDPSRMRASFVHGFKLCTFSFFA